MDDVQIIPVPWTTWHLFQPTLSGGPCCEMPFGRGPCFGVVRDNTVCAFVGFDYPFRNNPWRHRVIAEVRAIHQNNRAVWCNKNMWLLSRIGTLPPYRRLGYAIRLIRHAQVVMSVPYIECLTAHVDVCTVLAVTGFKCYGWRPSSAAYYYLWRRS